MKMTGVLTENEIEEMKERIGNRIIIIKSLLKENPSRETIREYSRAMDSIKVDLSPEETIQYIKNRQNIRERLRYIFKPNI